MSALKGIFPEWREGDTFHLEDVERWPLLNIGHGDFVEVNLKFTDREPAVDVDAGFVVMQRLVTGDGGLALLVHSVGSSDAKLSKELSSQFNRREGYLHLCTGRPCTEAEEGYLHVTALKVFTSEGFNPNYYTASHRRQVAKWLGKDVEPEGRGEGGVSEEDQPGTRGRSEERARKRAEEVDEGGELKGGNSRPLKRVERPSALRSSSAAKSRARGKGVSLGVQAEELRLPSEDEERKGKERESQGLAGDLGLGTPGEREEMSTDELRKKLDAVRVRLGGAPRPSIQELRSLPEDGDGGARERRESLDSGFAEELRGLTSGTTLRRKRPLEDTRGSSSRDVSSQLVRQAQERRSEKASRGSEGREKREKDSERKEILALNQVASRGASGGNGGDSPSRKGERGRSSRRKKKKKKRSKSRKRKRRLVNGVIMSSDGSGSSSDRDSSSEGSSTEGGFEAPLRRRSKANPGAVLRILVQRAQEALDQGSLVEVSKDTGRSITEGVKINTYFNLHVRPAFSQHRAAMRDLSLMSQILDTIRAGSIARAADLAAGHFLAAHQALMDQGWSQARYLEVADQEEQSATSAAILLEARKHAKASFKVETPDVWFPQKGWQRGWNQGGKGGWHQEKGKSKEKKGGKQKGRGFWQDKEGKGKNKWKESQDKGDKEEK